MSSPIDYYPEPEQVDAWCDDLLSRAEDAELEVQTLEDEPYEFQLGVRHTGGTYLAVDGCGPGRFYCFWQHCPAGQGPVLLHVPGYGAEMSAHPELVADGYNVLHINPLGYATPQGRDESRRVNDSWPVLPDTIRSLGEAGYADWLTQAAAAALWALGREGVDPERFAFFGTSQGGGTALLLASVFRDQGVRAVAADVAFLTDIPMRWEQREPGQAGGLLFSAIEQIAAERPEDLPAAWRALGLVDTISHARRLTMPTLLVAGTEDKSCPACTIESLFAKLPATRSYTEVAGQAHAYTTPFLHLARAWFRLYV